MKRACYTTLIFRYKALGCTIKLCKGAFGVSRDIRPRKNLDEGSTLDQVDRNRGVKAPMLWVPLKYQRNVKCPKSSHLWWFTRLQDCKKKCDPMTNIDNTTRKCDRYLPWNWINVPFWCIKYLQNETIMKTMYSKMHAWQKQKVKAVALTLQKIVSWRIYLILLLVIGTKITKKLTFFPRPSKKQ